jgi:nicotinate-nucleotide adenylyltransferase
VPADAAGLVLFGGTFDPPHRAHTELGSRARDLAAPGTWLLFVPAARSPFKEAPPTPDEHRVAMLRLAIASLDRAAIWTDELDRAASGEPSYFVDTARRARQSRTDARLLFIIGSDQAAEFHRWREPREILSLASPIVVPRAPLTSAEDLAAALRATGAWTQDEIARWRAALVTTPVLTTGATEARSILRKRGPEDPLLESMLDPEVRDYIREHSLYGME